MSIIDILKTVKDGRFRMRDLFDFYMKQVHDLFTGWDFAAIEKAGRIQEQCLPWSYGSIVITHARQANAMLDMGTGGGEFLASLQPFFPAYVAATEGYKPNIPVANSLLNPLGITVLPVYNDDDLPYENDSFDLIINRHESYSASEVRRLLKEDGFFLTQQCGGNDCQEINNQLGVPCNDEFSHWNLNYAIKELEANGFEILESKIAFPKQRFYDIGALLFYLNAIPWQVVDFDSAVYKEQLFGIHQSIVKNGFFRDDPKSFSN